MCEEKSKKAQSGLMCEQYKLETTVRYEYSNSDKCLEYKGDRGQRKRYGREELLPCLTKNGNVCGNICAHPVAKAVVQLQ
jgi:hypothetical protein